MSMTLDENIQLTAFGNLKINVVLEFKFLQKIQNLQNR